MKVLVIHNLQSGYQDGSIYDFIRLYGVDGDEITLRVLDGKSKIAALTAGLRENAPAEVGGVTVIKVEDYLSDETKAAGFPASDVLRFIFEDGCWVAVRPSGTEPKCKFYYCVCAPDKASAEEKYKALKNAFEPKI
jgi:phosphoglucomutase